MAATGFDSHFTRQPPSCAGIPCPTVKAIEDAQAARSLIDHRNGALLITDSGRGMPPAVRAHLFEPRHKGEQSTGFGIGLSLVARLCERYGIDLQLHDVAGGGTLATLRFAEYA